jgi:phenylacetate-CoA ligase
MRELGPVGWQCPTLDRGVHLMEPIKVDASDVVEAVDAPCQCGRNAVVVRGRKSDLVTVRGVDILPSTIENIVRRHPAITEYRLDAYHVRGEVELAIEIEPAEAVATEGDRARVAAEVAEDLKRSVGLRLQCEAVPVGSLPRDDPRPRRVVWRS